MKKKPRVFKELQNSDSKEGEMIRELARYYGLDPSLVRDIVYHPQRMLRESIKANKMQSIYIPKVGYFEPNIKRIKYAHAKRGLDPKLMKFMIPAINKQLSNESIPTAKPKKKGKILSGNAVVVKERADKIKKKQEENERGTR